VSLYFDSVGDYAYNNILGTPLANGGLTLSAWCKPEYDGDDLETTVVNFPGTVAEGDAYISLKWHTGKTDPPANPQWRATVFDGVSKTVTLAYTPASVAWKHLALRVQMNADGGYYVGLYWDGTLVDYEEAESGMYTGYLSAVRRIYVGCKLTGLVRSQYHKGYVGNLAVFFYDVDNIPSMAFIGELANGRPPWDVYPPTVHANWPLFADNRWALREVKVAVVYALTKVGATWYNDDNPPVKLRRSITAS